jgi:hypothetical protein
MKKVLFSIIISFVLVFAYMSVLTYFQVRYHQNEVWETNWKTPVWLPQRAYFYLFPLTPENYSMSPSKRLTLSTGFFLTNVLLYSIPIYFLTKYFSKTRKDKPPEMEPPPPPTFE